MTGRDFIKYILDNHLEDELMFSNVDGTHILGLVPVEDLVDELKQPKFTVLKYASENNIPVFEIYGEKFVQDRKTW